MLTSRKPPPGERCTPGLRAKMDLKSRPSVGKSKMDFVSTTLFTPGDVSTRGVAASTSTISVRVPTWSAKSFLMVMPTTTSALLRDVLKPCAETLRLYEHGGRFGST